MLLTVGHLSSGSARRTGLDTTNPPDRASAAVSPLRRTGRAHRRLRAVSRSAPRPLQPRRRRWICQPPRGSGVLAARPVLTRGAARRAKKPRQREGRDKIPRVPRSRTKPSGLDPGSSRVPPTLVQSDRDWSENLEARGPAVGLAAGHRATCMRYREPVRASLPTTSRSVPSSPSIAIAPMAFAAWYDGRLETQPEDPAAGLTPRARAAPRGPPGPRPVHSRGGPALTARLAHPPRRPRDRGLPRRPRADDHGGGPAGHRHGPRELDPPARGVLDHQRLPAGLRRHDARGRPAGGPVRRPAPLPVGPRDLHAGLVPRRRCAHPRAPDRSRASCRPWAAERSCRWRRPRPRTCSRAPSRPRALGVVGALTFLGMAAGPVLGAAILGALHPEAALSRLGVRARSRPSPGCSPRRGAGCST